MRARVSTSVNGQNLCYCMCGQGAVGYVIIKGAIHLPLIPQIVDHSNVGISPGVFDYNINEPCDNLPALNYLQNQPDLLRLKVGEFANGPYNSFSYLFPFAVGFGDGVGDNVQDIVYSKNGQDIVYSKL